MLLLYSGVKKGGGEFDNSTARRNAVSIRTRCETEATMFNGENIVFLITPCNVKCRYSSATRKSPITDPLRSIRAHQWPRSGMQPLIE